MLTWVAPERANCYTYTILTVMTITTHKCWHESHLNVLIATPTILTWISQFSKCWQEPHLKRVNCNWAAIANCNWWPQLRSVDRSRTWCWTCWLLHLTLSPAIIYILFNFPMYAIYSVNIIIILLLGFNILNSSLKMRLFRPFHFQSL